MAVKGRVSFLVMQGKGPALRSGVMSWQLNVSELLAFLPLMSQKETTIVTTSCDKHYRPDNFLSA